MGSEFELLQMYPRGWQAALHRSGHVLLTYVTLWQYWLWFSFIFLVNTYFLFLFRALTYRRADVRGRRAVGDKRRSAWPELFTCAFPLLWCVNILNNSLAILKAVEANGGYAPLTVQVAGFQWGWRYSYGDWGHARLRGTPLRGGWGAPLRPAAVGGASAEAHLCRRHLAAVGAIAAPAGGAGLFQPGLAVGAQGEAPAGITLRGRPAGAAALVADPLRLLRASGAAVLPTQVTVRLLATAEDVTHSWAVPALGLKLDCVPGRLYVAFLHLSREGVYYGQCSELCGWNHYNMPVVLYALPQAHFLTWWGLELHAGLAAMGARPPRGGAAAGA